VAAAATPTMPAPPGGAMTPTSPVAASPSSATPNPKLEQGSRMTIQVVQGLRWIAQNFPAAAKPISEINNLMREVQMAMMKGAQPGESAAPPVNG
jgi:hypothetical protein